MCWRAMTNIYALGIICVICIDRHSFSDLHCDKKVKSGSFFDIIEKRKYKIVTQELNVMNVI